MPPVLLSAQAQTDLDEILRYLEERNPTAAERLAETIDDRSRLLGQISGMGRTREELAPGLRSIVVEKYVLFYRVTADAVDVVRILHGARDVNAIMKSEGDDE